jgi:excisionase family DNA binding protein
VVLDHPTAANPVQRQPGAQDAYHLRGPDTPPGASHPPITRACGHHSPPASPAVPLADKLLLSDVECAALIGSSRSKVREWIKDGTLRSLRLDGHRRIRRADLDTFIERLADGSNDPPAPAMAERDAEATS